MIKKKSDRDKERSNLEYYQSVQVLEYRRTQDVLVVWPRTFPLIYPRMATGRWVRRHRVEGVDEVLTLFEQLEVLRLLIQF